MNEILKTILKTLTDLYNQLFKIQQEQVMPYQPLETLKDLIPGKDLLTKMCEAIRDFEGSPGDRNYRNNNPGNCRYSSVGYLPIYGQVGKDKDNFAIFKNYETGWLYLKNLVLHKVEKHPDWNLISFFKEYAPSTDGNNPTAYASFVAKQMGVNNFTWRVGNML